MQNTNEEKPLTMDPPEVKSPLMSHHGLKLELKSETSSSDNDNPSIKLEEKTDASALAMPPPPPRPKSNKRPADDSVKKSSPVKLLRLSEHHGECSNRMSILFFDVNKKKPLMISLNIKNSCYHIFNMFKWSEGKNIPFEYITDTINIVMYGYQFLETGFNHQLVICDDKIANEAMQQCEKRKLIPFDNPSASIPTLPAAIYEEYPCIHKGVLKTLVINNTITKTMYINLMTAHFLQNIIHKMKNMNETIELKALGNITDLRKSTIFDEIMFSITESAFR